MRRFKTSLILISSLLLSNAAIAKGLDIVIKSVTADGKPSYFINAGQYNDEISASQYKDTILKTISKPATVDASKQSNHFDVMVGPISDYNEAKSIQKTLEATHFPSIIPTNTTANIPTTQNLTLPQSSSEIKKDDKQIWNLRNADIRAVIAEVSKVTGKNFLIDPRVQGKVSMVATTPIGPKALYPLFLSILQVSGYAAIENGDVVKIIPNIDAKTQNSDLLSQMKSPPTGDAMLVEVVPVHYVPADQLVPVLRPLMPQWSNIAAYAPSNMLILSGRANNIRSIAHIIKQVDTSDAGGIDLVRLKHALAMDIAATLKDIMKTTANGNNRNQPVIAPDDRSNTLLISGNKTDRLRLRILIDKLDSRSNSTENSNTKVVYLNYLRAEDLVPILAGIAQANFSGIVGTTIGTVTQPQLDSTNPQSSFASNSNSMMQSSASANNYSQTDQGTQNTQNQNAQATQNEGSTKPTIQIIAEPNTNSIILSAPPTLIKTLESVIRQLDIKPAQLLIEALVAEVDESDANSLGIEWGTDGQTGSASKFNNGFAIINSKTNTTDFQAQIYALAQQKKANILSTPSVVVLDNRQAKILVGKQVSVQTTSYPNNGGGTTTATPYSTFERVNVALHLYVRPQITKDNGIQLQIDQGNDSIDPSATADTTNPTFKISSIVTSVHVNSGDIVVLGGLLQDSLGNDDNRLPILGNIPGVGKLFQHNIHTREKRVLIVFIKPLILSIPNDSQVTSQKYDSVRQYQLEWLRSQDYDKKNEDAVLPVLKEQALPRPFTPAVSTSKASK